MSYLQWWQQSSQPSLHARADRIRRRRALVILGLLLAATVTLLWLDIQATRHLARPAPKPTIGVCPTVTSTRADGSTITMEPEVC